MKKLKFVAFSLFISVFQNVFSIISSSEDERILACQQKLYEALSYGDDLIVKRFKIFKNRFVDFRYKELVNFTDDENKHFFDLLLERSFFKSFRELGQYFCSEDFREFFYLGGYLENIQLYINSCSNPDIQDRLNLAFQIYRENLENERRERELQQEEAFRLAATFELFGYPIPQEPSDNSTEFTNNLEQRFRY